MVLTPENIKSTKITPGKSGGISKTLLTPCRRLGLSRKVAPKDKLTPNLNTTLSSPANVSISSIENVTPQKTSEILANKSCRRLGLSRRVPSKDKRNTLHLNTTPTLLNSSAGEDSTPHKNENSTPVKVETPVNLGSVHKKKKRKKTGDDSKKSKKHIKERKIHDKSAESFSDTPTANDEKISDLNKNENKIEYSLDSQNDQDDLFVNNKRLPEIKDEKNMYNKVLKSEEKENLLEICNSENKTSVSNTDDNSKDNNISKVNPKQKSKSNKKKFGKIFSLKKSAMNLDDSDDDFVPLMTSSQKSNSSSKSEINNLLECAVQVERINCEDEATSVESSSSDVVELKKGKRKHNIVYSSDDDFVSSTASLKSVKKQSLNHASSSEKSLESSEKVEDLQEKIIIIGKCLKEKEKKLNILQRAETYKKLHNMEELRESIKIWKNGCKEALMDLLPKLQNHAEISMPALLQKLNIPDNILKYDVDSEAFVDE